MHVFCNSELKEPEEGGRQGAGEAVLCRAAVVTNSAEESSAVPISGILLGNENKFPLEKPIR